MLKHDVANSLPKPLLYLLTLPFVIIILPVSLIITMVLLLWDLKDGQGTTGFKSNGIWAIVGPGHLVGIVVITVIGNVLLLITRMAKKKK